MKSIFTFLAVLMVMMLSAQNITITPASFNQTDEITITLSGIDVQQQWGTSDVYLWAWFYEPNSDAATNSPVTGSGGFGNSRFKSSTNRAPRTANKGTPGEDTIIWLQMKLIADCGIVGLPNAGKSTLLSRISQANPKISDYPFTTLNPVLGVVNHSDDNFIVADIPGLMEGAHEGR